MTLPANDPLRRTVMRAQLAEVTDRVLHDTEERLKGLRRLWFMTDPEDRWMVEHTAAQVRSGRA